MYFKNYNFCCSAFSYSPMKFYVLNLLSGLDWCTLFDGVLNFLFIVLVRPARDNR